MPLGHGVTLTPLMGEEANSVGGAGGAIAGCEGSIGDDGELGVT